MLWSYAKLPVAPSAVVFALVHKITDQLVLQSQRPDGASTFDAQVCDAAALQLRLFVFSFFRRSYTAVAPSGTVVTCWAHDVVDFGGALAGALKQHLGPGSPQVPRHGSGRSAPP